MSGSANRQDDSSVHLVGEVCTGVQGSDGQSEVEVRGRAQASANAWRWVECVMAGRNIS